MGAQRDGRDGSRRRCQQRFDRRHRTRQPGLVAGRQAVEHRAHVLRGPAVERRVRATAVGCQRQRALPAIGRGRAAQHVSLAYEALQDAAQVAGVEAKAGRQVACGDAGVVRELVEDARLRERPGGGVQSFLQHADTARVEAVEAANGGDVGAVGMGHGLDLAAALTALRGRA